LQIFQNVKRFGQQDLTKFGKFSRPSRTSLSPHQNHLPRFNVIARPQLTKINAAGDAQRLPLDLLFAGILLAGNQRGDFLAGEVKDFS
jgi:hypothetical protein